MTKYIYSTLPADYCVTLWKIGPEYTQTAKTRFNIYGGAQVARSPSVHEFFVHTPNGIMTPCPDDVFEWVKEDPSFKHFVANGFMRVESKEHDVDKIASQMAMPTVQEGAPLTERDIIDPRFNGIVSAEDVEIKVIEESPIKTARKK